MKKLLVVITILLIAGYVWAGAPTRVNNFTSGTTIRSSEVNEDFNNLYGYLTTGVDNISTNGLDALTEISTSLCIDGQIMKKTSGVWACGTDSGAAGGDAWSDAVDSDILPTGADNTYDLGSVAASFADIFWDGTATGNVTGNLTGNVTGDVTGNASTSTALAANGSNCAAGSYALGVDASGASESCTDATTEINSEIANVLDGTDVFTDLNGNDVIDSDNYAAASIDLEHMASASVDSDNIVDDTILEADLNAIDAPNDNECLAYNAAGTNFSWEACGSGSGDVTSVGDCADGACLDGTADGGQYLRLYDGDSNYTEINNADANQAADLKWILPDANGTEGQVLEIASVAADAITLEWDDDGGAAGGDSVTVNGSAVDTTANLLTNTELAFALADGGAGGPDDVTATIVPNDSSFWDSNITDNTGSGVIVLNNAPTITSLTVVTSFTATDLIDSAAYAADSIDNEHINWADIDNLGDEGAVTLASTATALAANGANCNAGEYALGVDASGAVESCTDATTEINTEIGNVLNGTDAFTDFNGKVIDTDNLVADSADDTIVDFASVTCADLTTTDCGAVTSSGLVTATGLIATTSVQTGTIYDDAGSGVVTFTDKITVDSAATVSGVTFDAGATADPCGTLGEGAIFYNTTSNYFCYCDGTNDLKMTDNTTACF